MEFGIFIQNPVFAQNSAKDNPDYEHQVIMNDIEMVEGGRQGRLQVRVGHRAPLPRRVLAPVGQRRDVRLPRARHRAHPHRLGHLQPAPPGQPPGEGGRARGHARPHHQPALRVRHRPRRGQPRDPRLPPRRTVSPTPPPPRRSGRRRSPSSPRCGSRTSTRASTGSGGRCRPARSSPSPTARATRRCGTPRATRRATRWRRARASACSASRSARSPSSSRCWTPTSARSVDAEPVGAFVNDNLMVTAAAFVDEDSGTAFQNALDSEMTYLQSNVFRYHDTFPHPEGCRTGPS